ncbi:hypothetical protein Lgee_0739 [Legionella geestiana]|uniref:Uncharacterized protein n=1 Tax=Legionella geestiana TaxID=45065 RepID=A0A0W0U237_9GAMM|nr:hypothetical protein Lgee_0739 [Legionella geestiana]STX53778.1 Uncharacterised protein [Legionella geestiana]
MTACHFRARTLGRLRIPVHLLSPLLHAAKLNHLREGRRLLTRTARRLNRVVHHGVVKPAQAIFPFTFGKRDKRLALVLALPQMPVNHRKPAEKPLNALTDRLYAVGSRRRCLLGLLARCRLRGRTSSDGREIE